MMGEILTDTDSIIAKYYLTEKILMDGHNALVNAVTHFCK